MNALRGVALAVLAVSILTTATLGGPGGHGPKGGRPPSVKVLRQGEAFCPSAVLVFHNVAIQPGRCYVLLVQRTVQGTFLVFAAPDARIPPGQLVRLNTPAGAKLRGRIFYVVPIQTTAVIVPVNTITVVAARIEDYGPQVSIVLVGTPVPNLAVVFTVRL